MCLFVGLVWVFVKVGGFVVEVGQVGLVSVNGQTEVRSSYDLPS